MLKVLYFNAEFSDIGLMPIRINTYQTDAKKAMARYVERMKEIGVTVIKTSNPHWA